MSGPGDRFCPKIYCDTDIVSAIARRDLPPDEQRALDAIERPREAGMCDVRVSHVSAEEIARTPKPQTRAAIEEVYQATSTVSYTERQILRGISVYFDQYTCINSPMIEDNADWLRARDLGLSDLDAHHVVVASKERCQILLTLDRGMLHRAEAIQREFGLRVMKPSNLCAEMGWT